MPEGPTIKFLSKKLEKFIGKKVTEASGYGDMDLELRILNWKILKLSVKI
jgi:endonuclease-8